MPRTKKYPEIDQLIQEIISPEAIPVVQSIIAGKENVSEFKIADKLKVSINQLRIILYKLQEYNLLTSTRKKDKKKGWYIYYWTFNFNQANQIIKDLKQEKISTLKKQLDLENSSEFFTCSKKCVRLTLHHALEKDFKCPICERVLKKVDNRKTIKEIQNQLISLQEQAEVAA